MDQQRQKILAFLRAHLHGVVATVSPGSPQPESALVGYSETENLEIVFGTSSNSRKFENMRANPNVAFVVWGDEMTVQYEGTAHVAENGDVAELRAVHLEKHPRSHKYAFEESQRYVKITPRWIRYIDGTISPDDTFELTF